MSRTRSKNRPSLTDSNLNRLRTDLNNTQRALAKAQQRIQELEAKQAGWPFAATHLERLHQAMRWLHLAADPLTSTHINGTGHTPNHDSTTTQGAPTAWARAAIRRVEYRIRHVANYAEAQVSGEPNPNPPNRKTLRCTTRECRRSFPPIDHDGRPMERCSTCGGPLTPRTENENPDADKAA